MDEILKHLLMKYMEHVGICEGVDFLADHHRAYFDRNSDDPWTDAEWEMLKRIGSGEPAQMPQGELHSCG